MKPALRKTLAVLPLVAACAAFGAAAQAQTLSISGKVQDISCTATLPGGNTVNLPVAEPGDLPAVGTRAHSTPFTISLTGCGGGNDGLLARAMFYNSTPGTVTLGRLNLAASSTGSGWQYEFRNSSGASFVNIRRSPDIVIQSTDPGVTIASGAANLTYRVMYYRSSGTLITGTGTASVNFVLYYV